VIPVSILRLGEDVEASVLEVLRSGHLAQGPVVLRLEELMARAAGTEHAVAVSNGTVSLMGLPSMAETSAGERFRRLSFED
jgi:dTDP-4-amino-4,6-dideoxygalactose transaminase